MLVLTRRAHEEIVIDTPDGRIVVQVVTAQSGKAQLGITAPREIPVHRKEIWDAIEREGRR